MMKKMITGNLKNIHKNFQILSSLFLLSVIFIFSPNTAFAADYGTYDHSQDASIVSKMSDLNNISGTSFILDLTDNKVPVKQSYIIMQHLTNQNPEIFYLTCNSKTCKLEQAGGYVTRLTVQLEGDRAYIQNQINEMKAAAAEILNSVDFTKMNDIETALYLHNCLVDSIDYSGEQNNYKTAYGALVKNQATCIGYVQAYNYLLSQCGIPSGYAVSTKMVHAWNVVQIDGKWYHTDVCWDDTGSTLKKSFNYFLVTEAELLAIESGRSDMDIQMENYSYKKTFSSLLKNRFWNETATNIAYANGDWYYTSVIDNQNSILKYNFKTNKKTVVTSDLGVWNAWQSRSYYGKNYSNVASDGKNLYYSTQDQISQYNVSTGKSSLYAKPNTDTGYIYKLKYEDGAVWYALGTSYNNIGSFQKAAKTEVKNPGKTSIKSISAVSKGFKITWKKQTSDTNGYEIQYATDKGFSDVRVVTVNKNTTTSRTISKLKASRTYYVRIRTYGTADGTKFYSDWSAVKKVKTDK